MKEDLVNIRKQALKNLAHRIGAIYSENDSAGIASLAGDLKLFKKGFSRKTVRNVLTLESNWGKLHIFDLLEGRRPEKGSGKMRTACFVHARQLGLPLFHLRPKHLADHIVGLFKEQGIAFPEHRRFSTKYILNSESESMIRHYFKENLLDFLSKRKDWHAEGLGFYLLLWGPTRLMEGKELGEFIENSILFGSILIKNRYDPHWLTRE